MARKRIRFWAPGLNKIRLGYASEHMLFIYLLLVGFIFLLAPQSLTSKFQLAFAHVFRWPLSIGRNISLSVSRRTPATELPLEEVVSRREYNQLQNHLVNVQEQLNLERQKNKKLSGLRKNRQPFEGIKWVLADVITASISEAQCELIINRGGDDGLTRGQFVLGDNSVIGTISELSARTAKVTLITDPKSNIAVKIADTERVMTGDGGNVAKIHQLLWSKHKVKVGHVVLAGKKPGFLEAPMITARVARCGRDSENPTLWHIVVEPVCRLERLTDVAVIVTNPQR